MPVFLSGSLLLTGSLTLNQNIAPSTNSPILIVTGSVSASSNLAQGANYTPNLVAAANNDVLVGLDINPTFSTGSFTVAGNWGLRTNNINVRSSTLPLIYSLRINGTISSPTAVLNGDELGRLTFAGQWGSSREHFNTSAYIRGVASENFNVTNNGSILSFFNTTNGAATAIERLRIFNTGNILIQNGGTFTDAGFRLDVSGSTRITNNLTISGSTEVTGSQRITGSLSVSQGITGSSILSTGTITAQTLVVSTISSSVTFSSGSNIFGNNPANRQTFTGSLNVSGSGNHFILGANVGIGTASPTNPLHIQSNTLSQLNVTALSGNTNAQINLEPVGTGIALIGPANPVDFVFRTNATERVRISSAGSSSFTANALANSADAATINLKQNSTTANTGIYLERSGEQKGYYMYVGGSTDNLTFQRNNAGTKADVMSLTRDGCVLIGTACTRSTLTIKSINDEGIVITRPSDAMSSHLKISTTETGGDAYTVKYNTFNNEMIFNTYAGGGTGGNIIFRTTCVGAGSESERLRINCHGIATFACQICAPNGVLNCLGVGSPFSTTGGTYQPLQVKAGLANSGLWVESCENDSGLYINHNSTAALIGGSYRSSAGYKDLILQTAGNSRVVIFCAGSVVIGNTTNYSDTRLSVVSAGTTSSTYSFIAKNSTPNDLFIIRSDGLVAYPKINDFTTANSPNTWINPASSYGIYINTSSIRYKRDVVNYDRGICFVQQLRPVFYKGKSEIDGDKQFAGFIAEEIHDLGLNEFVQYNDEGCPNSLAYPNMVALLTKAIQELKCENDIFKTCLGIG